MFCHRHRLRSEVNTHLWFVERATSILPSSGLQGAGGTERPAGGFGKRGAEQTHSPDTTHGTAIYAYTSEVSVRLESV